MSAPNQRRHALVGCSLAALFVAMVGASYAAVPLYKLFCQSTGYGGATQVAKIAPTTRGERTMSVRFDANVAPGLPWTFEPETPAIQLRVGETATVFFRVKNISRTTWSATAAYNVSPDQAGAYFDKISCFCFSEQTLDPGESAEWPVVFFLDPALERDETMTQVAGVTLSYTFFASKRQGQALAQARPAP